eukprot:6934000-Pyramimonas_sp.AAC.1
MTAIDQRARIHAKRDKSEGQSLRRHVQNYFARAQFTHHARLVDLHLFGRPLLTLPPTPDTVIEA